MWYAIVAILILIADQGLKYWVTLNIPLDTGHVTLIPGVSATLRSPRSTAVRSSAIRAG